MDKQEHNGLATRQYLAALQHRAWLIALAVGLAAGIAFLVSRSTVPVYEASATLLLNIGQGVTDPTYDDVLISERLTKTYSQLLKGPATLDQVRSRLGLPLSNAQLDKMVSVEAVRDTQLISLQVRHPNPAMAAHMANTIAQVFIEQNAQREISRMSSSEQNLSREMQGMQAQIDSTQQALDTARGKPNPDPAEVARLETLLGQYRASYAGLVDSYEKLRSAEARRQNTISVAEPAQVPTKPVLPRTLVDTLLAALVGAMLSVGAAFGIEYLDDTVKTPQDVERIAHVPTLASIIRFAVPQDNGQRPLISDQSQSPLAESYRVLRTNLQFSTLGIDRPAPILLVTSAQPLEGKTTTVTNLAASLALNGKQVLLVDADLRKPSVYKHLDLRNTAGLTTLLLRPQDSIDQVIQNTRIPGLRVLAAGPIPVNPAELLDLPATKALLETLRQQADYVIIDSPPVLNVTDSGILAQKVDGVVLVAEMGRTRTDTLELAVASLQRVKARLLGVVLNKVAARPGSSRYGGYSYGYHGDDQQGQRHSRTALTAERGHGESA